jgi:hypothetical protein
VGYVNTQLVKGYNLISNPLDNKGTGGNTIQTLFASLPGGSQVFHFAPGPNPGFRLAEVDLLSGEITGPAATDEVPPGDGVFVFMEAPGTITFVGEVKTGTGMTDAIPTGLSVQASQVPQAGTATGDLKFPAGEGDQISVWSEANQRYDTFTFSEILGGWDPRDPTIEVGEAFFVLNAGAQKNWVRDFRIDQ